MNGKKTCKMLKEIRRKIAEENDIEFITSECQHKGDCAGTCPKCEEEVRFLESELNKRSQLGKAITVAGLSLALTGCVSPFAAPQGLVPNPNPEQVPDTEVTLQGDVPYLIETDSTENGNEIDENSQESGNKKDDEETETSSK